MYDRIKVYLGKREAIAIKGPRQAGKTTLMRHIAEALAKIGKRVSFLSFEQEKALTTFINDLELFEERYVKGFDAVFIDEFQYAKGGGKRLKALYDQNESVQFIISGSSSLELTFETGKYMVGRLISFELSPFSFREALRTKAPEFEKILQKRSLNLLDFPQKANLQSIDDSDLKKHFDLYLRFGGYPRVVFAETQEEKKTILGAILDEYLLKEIQSLLELTQKNELVILVRLIALQIGQLLSYKELCLSSGLTHLALKKQLRILEETFILKRLTPFYTNRRTELVKTPKAYFQDLGFRNHAISNFQEIELRNDRGALVENYVYLILKSYETTFNRVHFWRSKSGAEVDFILEKEGHLIPIEVKYTPFQKAVVGKSLVSFIEKFSPKVAYVLTKGFIGQRKIQDCKVFFVPVWQIMDLKY